MAGAIATNPAAPRQTPPESDYVHAFVDSLYAWSDSNAGFLDSAHRPIEFIPALQQAARNQQSRDFVSAKLHWTHPSDWEFDPFVVSYHYHVHISVSAGTSSWKAAVARYVDDHTSGATTSSWDMDAPDVTISVNYTNRTATAQASPPAPLRAVTGTASGSFSVLSGHGPETCTWKLDNTTSTRVDLLAYGNDSAAAKRPFIYDGFQNSRQLGFDLVPSGFTGVRQTCPLESVTPLTVNFATPQVFLGTDGCYADQPPGPDRTFNAFAMPIWDLGKSAIKLPPSPFSSYTASCSLYRGGPIPAGATTSFSGNYSATLTRLPSATR